MQSSSNDNKAVRYEDRPLQTHGTDVGRAANRRVEFLTRYTPSAP